MNSSKKHNKIKDHLFDDSSQTIKLKRIEKDQFGLCKICNDKASGIHYGVATCEGCKGFFKRCIIGKKLHNCINKNNCIVKIDDRRKCKSCRFKKCLALGMSLESRKMGRIPLKEKLKMLEATASNNDSLASIEANQKTTELYFNDFNTEINFNLNNNKLECQINNNNNDKENFPISQQSYLNRSTEDIFNLIDNELVKTNDDDDDIIAEMLDSKVNTNFNEIEDLVKSMEKQMSIFDDKKSNLIDLNERDSYIKNNFDLNVFLKLHSKTTETAVILTNEDLFFNMDNENMLYFLTVVRDKVNKVYLEFTESIEKKLVIAHEIINKRVYFPHPTKQEVYGLFSEYLKKQAQIFFEYLSQLPGLNSFCQHDFTTILDHNVSLIHAFRVSKLFIQNENYIIIENYHFDRNSLFELFGPIAGELIFTFMTKLNNLSLKDEELSLLIPFVLTLIDAPLIDDSFLKEINLYYARALLYEFSLNFRDKEYINQVAEVIELSQALRKGFHNVTIPKLL